MPAVDAGRQIIKIAAAFILIVGVIAGLYYESAIRKYFPEYSAVLFASAVICFAGLIHALIMRNLLIALLTVCGAAAVPWMVVWFMNYWPFIAPKLTLLGK